MAISAADQARAAGLSIGLGAIFGETPQVVNKGDYLELIWTPEQYTKLAKKFRSMMAAGGGTIRVKAEPIFIPYVTERAIPYALGAVGAGFLAGKMF